MIIRFYPLVCVVIFLAPLLALAQAQKKPSEKVALEGLKSQSEFLLKGDSLPAEFSLTEKKRLSESGKKLQSLLIDLDQPRLKGKAVPLEYAASLTSNQQALTLALSPMSKFSAIERAEIIEGIEADFAIKTKFANKNPNNPYAPITVTAKTLKALQEIKGLRVWYVTKGMASVIAASRPFDKESSPTSQRLTPGAYLMWSKDPSRPC